MAAGSMEYWRNFFRSAGSDIIEVIESAIMVAISDCPTELRSRRDQITEKLYSCPMPCCSNSDRSEQITEASPEVVEEEEGRGSCKKESEAGSSNSSGGEDELNPLVSNLSYNEVEALTEEIEEESQTFGEVLRIKEIIANPQDESDSVLFDSLRRLQLMALSVEALKVTDIGRAVNGLRKHNSKQIRHLVRTLVEDWKNLVDEWVNATAAIATENVPDSDSPADMDEEEGLPFPPLDEGALWATQATGMQLSEFFDGMDEDGNLRINDQSKNDQERYRHPKSLELERKQHTPEERVEMRRQEPVVRQAMPMEASNGYTKTKAIDKGEMRRQEPAINLKQSHVPNTDKEDIRRQEAVVRQTKPHDALNGQAMHHFTGSKQSIHATADLGSGRRQNLSSDKKTNGEMYGGVQRNSLPCSQNKPSRLAVTDSGPGRPQKTSSERRTSGQTNTVVQRKPPAAPQDTSKKSDDTSLRAKLEAAKRKLQENYQNAENAKRQRTVQVMEVHDIPKTAHINRQPVVKHKSNIRTLLNRRR